MFFCVGTIAVLFATCVAKTTTANNDKPNLMIILVDDMGFQDVGYRTNTDLKDATPFIDSRAAQGIKLDFHYVQPACTPTRGSMLTGRYAFRLGFQRGVIPSMTSDSLPLEEQTLAELLQAEGYNTGLFGKWHLGASTWSMVPNQRGFNKYSGYYGGAMDFWTKTQQNFVDLHVDNDNNEDPRAVSTSTYAQYVYQESLNDFLRDHNVNHEGEPFFAYYAMQTVHSPLQAPDDLLSHPACAAIPNQDRKIFCAMMMVTDNMVENTFQVLADEGFDRNTVVVFSNDNGGNPTQGGYNMPLRGQKGSMYEGGIRSVSFIWSALIPVQAQGTTYGGLLHLVDWLPTFMSLATNGQFDAKREVKLELDGFDVWNAIITNSTSPRTELVHNFDSSVSWGSAIRVGDYKLITGQIQQMWTPVPDSTAQAQNISYGGEVEDCGSGNRPRCNYLFNIKDDPTETTNLILTEPERAANLKATLESYASQEAPCSTCGSSESAAATQAAEANGGYWTPWKGTKPTDSGWGSTNKDTFSQSSFSATGISLACVAVVGVLGFVVVAYRRYKTTHARDAYVVIG
eukprot:m.39919 g.39919  ORF g.39919 m.39919 type:complete len:571 (-) comp18337_c0_seq1:239-1951(-)